jgi:hypothetical protein
MNCATLHISGGSADATRQYYCYPEGTLKFDVACGSTHKGFFRYQSATCFGACDSLHAVSALTNGNTDLPNAADAVSVGPTSITLPFDPHEVASNLRLERYSTAHRSGSTGWMSSSFIQNAYYAARKFMPVQFRKHLQRMRLADWRSIPFPNWPVDCSVDLMFENILRTAVEARGIKIPFIWFWPKGHSGCLIMTHDVEQRAGRDFCSTLMTLEEEVGLRSSFQLIPEIRYEMPSELLAEIRRRGHEVNIHDLNHDGHLFRERTEFLNRAAKIRSYANQFGAEGFRSAILYRNLDWYDELGVSYDMSVPNVAHLDPQRGGCCTVMPYFIGDVLELPLTTTQDYSLFHILGDYSLQLWNRQIEQIISQHGLLSFNIHPDYVMQSDTLPVYKALLSKLTAVRAQHNLWAALPRDVNRWWRQRSNMRLLFEENTWRIVGDGSEQAVVAYAAVENGRLTYSVE